MRESQSNDDLRRMKIRFDLDCPAPGLWESALGTPTDVLLPQAMDALCTVLAEISRPEFSGRCFSLALFLGDDEAIAALNEQFRGRNKPTNVLSFPSPEAFRSVIDEDGTQSEFLGDIAIARETLLRETTIQSKLPAHHFLHLAMHGTLHLLGFDHEQEHDAREMEDIERACLRRLGIADPYLLPPDPEHRSASPGRLDQLTENNH